MALLFGERCRRIARCRCYRCPCFILVRLNWTDELVEAGAGGWSGGGALMSANNVGAINNTALSIDAA